MRTDDPLAYSETALVAVRTLRAYSRNSRTHDEAQIGQIQALIEQFGFLVPLIVDEHDTIIAGHGRLEAAKRLGMEQVPVIRRPGLSDAERAALVLADNRVALNSSWDETMLAKEVAFIQEAIDAGEFDFDLGDAGFGEVELKDLAEVLAPEPEEEPPRELTVTEEPAVCRAGDRWMLGPHTFTVAGASLNDLRAADILIIAWERQNKGEAVMAGGGMTFRAKAESLGIEFKRQDTKATKARHKAD
ncbi:ParB/Srx family N-terminal domain-containing protein [Methylobacterium sp. Leaf91]|uniref:ParB/Srx family N-terminal domain-containing protein n=1 Tax=Methylobacterium sp. Leaf91 TaxID=1736247 RepID=UPI0006F4B97B|nr:ParB/Srx family N-terminal domain-containing protein [Methylobacterium sp. Leaf91]KQO85929.1 hypothetical protein ASF32_09590 [Methylobacterium sp. Leaf91]